MNTLEHFRTDHGLTYAALAEMAANDKTSVFRHCHAQRIPAEACTHYEAKLGIPRELMRPDLWPPATETLPPVLGTPDEAKNRPQHAQIQEPPDAAA